MSDRVPCEFFLIRYVPDAVKGEYTNIGVLLREAGREESARVRFTRDWSRVRCMDADADIGLLEALEGEIDTRLRLGLADHKPVVAVIEDTFSNSIQMTEARACLAENMVTELELLMRLHVEPLRVKQDRQRTGRAVIASAMRRQFERAGVWALMRKRIAASMYTLPGDPMKIDCGYRPNGVIKMFHAVSLDGDVEAAKVLAYTAPQLRDGVVRVEGARLELTAVVEPLRAVSDEDQEKHEFEDESVERYRFGVETMESQQIRVVTMNDLARAAQTARIDLRL
ncbi:MAG: DUF3037 domain-containing protein [Acidobacteriaceae bacterium]